MTYSSFSHSVIGLTFVIFFVIGCSGVSAPIDKPIPPTDTPIPIETPILTETPIPTDTPEPSPTPTSISTPGIHEPIVVKGFSYRKIMSPQLSKTVEEDLQLQILDAEIQESMKSGDSGLRYPDDSSDVFLTLMFRPIIPYQALDWIALNTGFICGAETYQPESKGLKVGENSIFKGLTLTYVVPGDANFAECILQLPDGEGIPLTSFFD